ncbi:MAG: winged helix-turn-helix transcriptional regulator [Caldilineaceae bacterium]|nr:winged helix-turn-helix transcriptional regulator [Caldilineaceae bacterium]
MIVDSLAGSRLTHCSAEHDAELASAAAAYLLDIDAATGVAELFKALSDPTRVRIISLLAHTELCVGDLSLVLAMSQPAISYQLRILRSLRIVRARKEGKHVFYTLDDEHIHQLYLQGVNHISHS